MGSRPPAPRRRRRGCSGSATAACCARRPPSAGPSWPSGTRLWRGTRSAASWRRAARSGAVRGGGARSRALCGRSVLRGGTGGTLREAGSAGRAARRGAPLCPAQSRSSARLCPAQPRSSAPLSPAAAAGAAAHGGAGRRSQHGAAYQRGEPSAGGVSHRGGGTDRQTDGVGDGRMDGRHPSCEPRRRGCKYPARRGGRTGKRRRAMAAGRPAGTARKLCSSPPGPRWAGGRSQRSPPPPAGGAEGRWERGEGAGGSPRFAQAWSALMAPG